MWFQLIFSVQSKQNIVFFSGNTETLGRSFQLHAPRCYYWMMKQFMQSPKYLKVTQALFSNINVFSFLIHLQNKGILMNLPKHAAKLEFWELVKVELSNFEKGIRPSHIINWKGTICQNYTFFFLLICYFKKVVQI